MQGRFDENFINPHQHATPITNMRENGGKKCDILNY
jgi:hypothetical protein